MGAGGAGAAVAHALLSEGVRQLSIFDVDRSAPRAWRTTSTSISAAVARWRARSASTLAEADGLVNTTPMGMAKLPGMPVPVELLRKQLWVAEIVYFPLETELLRNARAWAAARWMAATWRCFRR
jgi:shikimate dehydrogenase